MFKKQPKILIYLGNVRVGGAMQVSRALFNYLNKYALPFKYDLYVSRQLAEQIDFTHLKGSPDIYIGGSRSYSDFLGYINLLQLKYDLVFSLFGPKITLLKARKEVSGFAQLLLLQNLQYGKYTFLQRLKFSIHIFFHSRSQLFFVEADHVKAKLKSTKRLHKQKVVVSRNVVNPIVKNGLLRFASNLIKDKKKIYLGYCAGFHPHKNHQILIKTLPELKRSMNCDVVYLLTLDKSLQHHFPNSTNFICVGNVPLEKLKSFYTFCDGIVFPSLAECSSAAPLEAMFFKKPLFASNRDFVTEDCEDYPEYFDPNRPCEYVEAVTNFFNNSKSIVSTHRTKLGSKKKFIEMFDILKGEL